MQMKGEERIATSQARVWAALNDVEILRRCIPGCDTLEKLSDTQMRATAKIRVGPVSARFAGEVTLSEIDPPNGYRIDGEGQGGIAGFARGGATVRLETAGDDTILHYSVDAQVGGKLAQLGARLIDATAQQMAKAFFGKFAAILAGDEPDRSHAPALGDVPAPLDDRAGQRQHGTPPVPARGGTGSWLAPALASTAIAILAWRLFANGADGTPTSAAFGDEGGIIVLILVAMSGAIGFLFGERAR